MIFYNPRTEKFCKAASTEIQNHINNGMVPVLNSDEVIDYLTTNNVKLKDVELEIEEAKLSIQMVDLGGNLNLNEVPACNVVKINHGQEEEEEEEASLLDLNLKEETIMDLTQLNIRTISDLVAADDETLCQCRYITQKTIGDLRKRASELI